MLESLTSFVDEWFGLNPGGIFLALDFAMLAAALPVILIQMLLEPSLEEQKKLQKPTSVDPTEKARQITTKRSWAFWFQEFRGTFMPGQAMFDAKPFKPAKDEAGFKQFKKSTDRFMQWATQVYGYLRMYGLLRFYTWAWTGQTLFDPRGAAFNFISCQALGYYPVLVDEIERYLLEWYLPAAKCETYKPGEFWALMINNFKFGCCTFAGVYPSVYFGYTGWTHDLLTTEGLWAFMIELVIGFVIWNFVMFQLGHTFFHSIYYDHHKEHHTVRGNCCTLRGNTIDFDDLWLEQGGYHTFIVPFLLALGYPKMHYFAHVVISPQLGLIGHCANPWHPFFFFPPLDYFININVAHHLHHSSNRGHYSALPYHQLFSKGWQRDRDEYIKNVRVKYNFRF